MRASRYAVVAVSLGIATNAWCDITLTLKRSFIEQYKNRATIEANYTIDKAHAKPNPPAKDADLHIAGRSPQIGLATVAEIQNAATVPDALQVAKDNTGGSAIKVKGAWRIWPEHGGSSSVHKQAGRSTSAI